jgi:hypothetical protein
MRKMSLLLLPILLLAGGCFPIDLEVRDGKILIPRQEGFFTFDPASGKAVKLAEAKGGKPVFARFSPDSKDVLTVVKSDAGFDDFAFTISPVAGGEGRAVYTGKNTAAVSYSPDGGNLAVIQMSEKEIEKFKSKMPELWLVPLAGTGGAPKKLADFVGVYCRWLPDSKKLLTFQIDKKDEQGNFSGNVVQIDLDGKVTPLGAAMVNQSFHQDVSPDGKKLLLTAFAAGKVGDKLEKDKLAFSPKLYELDVAAGTWRKIDKDARYAVYSRDGKQVLLATPPEGFVFDAVKLEVADADLKTFKTVVNDAFMPMSIGGEGRIFAGWMDDKTILFFVQKAVYGTEGKSLQLMTVGTDGKDRKNLQPHIDIALTKLEK